MRSVSKTITILCIALLAGALSACQPATPAATPSATLPPGVGRIAFYSTTGPGGSGTSAISLINSDGSGLAHLSPGLSPYWSPDGRKIAFGVWVVNADGTEKQRLMDVDYAASPLAWSPDGQQIAFATRKGNFAGSIYVADLKGG